MMRKKVAIVNMLAHMQARHPFPTRHTPLTKTKPNEGRPMCLMRFVQPLRHIFRSSQPSIMINAKQIPT
jgi:hypothetical protein